MYDFQILTLFDLGGKNISGRQVSLKGDCMTNEGTVISITEVLAGKANYLF